MHNNIENRQIDTFSELVRQKLESHQTPVEPGVWDAIEAKLPARKAKIRIAMVWWLTAGLAAAVALLLTLSPFTWQPEQHTAQTKTVSSKKIALGVKVDGKVENLSVAKPISIKTTYINQDSIEISKPEKLVFEHVIIAETEDVKVKTVSPAATVEQLAIAQNNTTLTNETDTAKIETKQGVSDKLQLKQEDWKDPLKEKSTNNWELIAMIGGAGKTSQSGNAVMETSTLRPRMSIVKAQTASTLIFEPEEFSDKSYMSPISAGFAVSRKLTKNLSLETGIVYTYLLTNFKNNQVTADLNLHYVGVPARFTYKLITGTKWNMYAGAGGMVEKGLWSVYVQKQNFTAQTITTTVSDKIVGYQWSINAALGGEYSLVKSAAIYFEPKLSYYFDNNQPLSTRTENKLVIGFEGGLRYKF